MAGWTFAQVLKDYQTLFASLAAIVAASIAFAGVVYTQGQTRRNAEAERKARRQSEEDAFEREKRHERKVMINCLTAELQAVVHSIEARSKIEEKYLESKMKVFNETLNVKQIILDFEYNDMEFGTPFFESNFSKIGLLSSGAAATIVRAYWVAKLSRIPLRYIVHDIDELKEYQKTRSEQLKETIELISEVAAHLEKLASESPKSD